MRSKSSCFCTPYSKRYNRTSNTTSFFSNINPPKTTKEVVASVANSTLEEAQQAIAAANEALPKWARGTTAKERAAALHRVFELHNEHAEELAQLITLENGKPLSEARAEIAYGASYFEWYAGEARRIYGQVVPPAVSDRLHLHVREAAGVAGVITPWNFPNAMISRKVAAALAAGCTAVVKPAEDTPLSALALARLCEVAGVPAGVVNVVPCDRRRTPDIGRLLCESVDVDVLSFTGSSAVGKILLAQSASTVKRLALELGGNAPFIVFPSANIDAAVEGAMTSKFRCCGQTCVSANRFFVHSAVHDKFVRALSDRVRAELKCGDGSEPGINQGSLINDDALKRVHSLVKDALKSGAKLICGGDRLSDLGSFYQPTVLTDVKPDMSVCVEEIFGPVVPVVRFESESEVVAMANRSRNGLAAYIYSGSVPQLWRVAAHLQAGMVGLNEGLISCPEAAFGGIKESGMGREGGHMGIDEFTEWKYLAMGQMGTQLKD